MKDNGREYLEIDNFKKYSVKILYTNKNFGNVKEMSRENISEKLNLSKKKIVSGFQVHSAKVENISSEKSDKKLFFEETDGFITNSKDVVIYTKHADCLAIYFIDDTKGIIAAIHSGWQGTYNEIAIETIAKFKSDYASNLSDIKILIGPGISKERYEVGQEFYEKFREKFKNELLFSAFEKIEGKIYFDNKLFNYLNLIENGISKDNISINNTCTYEDKTLHSYRRDKEESGRSGSFMYYE